MKIYFVTTNRHKFEEARRVMEDYNIRLYPASIEKVEIQCDDVGRIALYAAKQAYSILKAPVIVEDAGLFIEALNGFPGPYSEYVYRKIGLRGILKLMEKETNRKAWFESAVALILPPWEKVFKGRVDGIITFEPKGDGGFGYDPIFMPKGENRTFAEMSVEDKNKYSHRAKAFRRLGSWLSRLHLNRRALNNNHIKE